MPPLVAVIIPTFNRARLLGRAVSSVLGQSFRDFEAVVVDDGSTDNTVELVAALKNGDQRLRYVKIAENRGVAHARNAGVLATGAPFLAFLDSDDEWLPEKLEKQVTWFERNPGMAIVQTKEFWVRHGRRVNPPLTHAKFEGDLFAASLERCMITPSSVMLRRGLFDQAGGFNGSLPACEDYDLWLRTTCRYRVGLVDEYLLTRYGGHADQLSAIVPMLDRYRIQSLEGLLAIGVLSAEQERLARNNLLKRARILANGFKKHGNDTEHERYHNIVERYR